MLNDYIKKYKSLSIPLKATFWFTICNFVQRGASALVAPFFTRLLSTEEYGIYSTYATWELLLFMVISLSLYKSIMNLFIKYENHEYVLSSLCSLELLLTGFWLFFVLISDEEFLATLLGMSKPLVILLFINFIFQAGFECWALYKRYIYDYKKLIIATLGMAFGSSILGLVGVVFVEASAISRVIGKTIVVAIIGITIYISVFYKNGFYISRTITRFSLGFCIPLMPHYLSEFVLHSSDKLMINSMCGPAEVAIYSVAYSVASLINLFANAMSATFGPYQYQKMKIGDYANITKKANQILIVLGCILIGIMLFGREIIYLFGGERYLRGAEILIPICLGVYFSFMTSFFSRVQEYYEKKMYITISSVACALVNIGLNYIFIAIYGFQAAAYTTFISYFLFCIIQYFIYLHTCQEILAGQQIFNIKTICQISAGLVLGGVFIHLINEMMLLKYGFLCGLVYFLLTQRKKMLAD